MSVVEHFAKHVHLMDTLLEALHQHLPYLAHHSLGAAALAVALGKELGWDADAKFELWVGDRLHDVGALMLPRELWLKPSGLSEAEVTQMRQHPTHGYWFLHNFEGLETAAEIAYAHHERWNGSGYPRGLAGEAIPRMARVFAVADVYDALTHPRPYRAAWAPAVARDYLLGQAGVLFDPDVTRALQVCKRDPHVVVG